MTTNVVTGRREQASTLTHRPGRWLDGYNAEDSAFW